ncbi:MAG: GyrI-like domain-containing protein [Candidatus Sericytochromatia bacterium]
MEPKFIKKDKTILVGLLNIADKNSNFGEFWDKFFSELNNISNRSDYKVCYGLEAYPPEFQETDLFYYMPCVEIKNIDIVPNNMFIKVLPESEYAVFKVKGLQNISKTFHYVFHHWLPNSGYKMSGAYDFEYYDERFDSNNENSEIDLYIPIKKE